VAVALSASRLMSALLYGITAIDGISFTVSALLVLSIALAAACFPAWRASRADPLAALRASSIVRD
jgi:ABC-type lipoprotein release transport system permease subunit